VITKFVEITWIINPSTSELICDSQNENAFFPIILDLNKNVLKEFPWNVQWFMFYTVLKYKWDYEIQNYCKVVTDKKLYKTEEIQCAFIIGKYLEHYHTLEEKSVLDEKQRMRKISKHQYFSDTHAFTAFSHCSSEILTKFFFVTYYTWISALHVSNSSWQFSALHRSNGRFLKEDQMVLCDVEGLSKANKIEAILRFRRCENDLQWNIKKW